MCTPGFEAVSYGGGGGGGGGSNFAAAQASDVSIGTSDRGLGQNGLVTFTPLTATGIAPQFTSPSAASFTAGQSGSFTVSATGTPLPGLAATGLPAGLTFTDNGDGTATLAGRPTSAGTRTVQVTAANGTAPDAQQNLAVTVAPPAAPIKATGKPGTPVLSDDNGWDTGLRDSDYTITMNMWWGNNGSTYRLFENGNLIASRDLVDNSPAAQQVAVPVTGKADGTYVYTCQLTNSFGTTSCGSHTVTVADAKPGTPVLSKIQTGAWGSGDYTVAMNMWWGTNGDTYRLYENGVLIDNQTLTVHTPAAQQATTVVSGRPNGTYEYRAELSNEFGTTTSSGIYTVTVGQ
ncbi:hypothetical protein [Nakamurella sp.]|uniref:hypothetical protein n=1 Tax=Nakamurella sp. TaxID=1869182 RepID=UPI0037850217